MAFFMRTACLLVALLVAAPVVAAVNIDAFIERAEFDDIKISPNGEYYAATVPLEDRTVLVFLKREDNSVHGTFNLGRNRHVAGFWWVTDERVVISGAEKIGAHDRPRPTGDLFAVDADGGKATFVAGQSGGAPRIATRARSRDSGAVAAFFIARLPDSPREVLISVSSFSDDAFTFAERVSTIDGRRVRVARAPVRNGTFVADASGQVRAVVGSGTDNVSKLYLRQGREDDWRLINDQASSGRIESPLGFSKDGGRLYLLASRDRGPDVIVAFDIATGSRSDVLADDARDPEHIIYNIDTGEPVGARFLDGKPRTAFIDPESPEARQQRGLEAAFPGQAPVITSHTRDGRFTLVHVASDRNPGDFYLFDTVGKSAKYVISRRSSIDPDTMAEARPFSFEARDGLKLTGYLTLPPGSMGKALPMVVMPHGGPFGVQEDWHFEDDSQLLAAGGYAVLRVDFRGSGGRGRDFRLAGAQEWGGKMQDDVTDATRWAVRQGIADASRICIYGASYGGYAALMGVAKEPALYRCAVGYIGVYDLPLMHMQGDIQERGSGETYLREWIGERDQLASVSPNHLADRIRVPVMLAAGGEDQRAPIEHSRRMERALAKAGVPVETLYYKTEGHGFYVTEHRKEFYTRLLAFLGRHLAPGAATPPVAAAETPARLDLEQGTP